MRRGIAICLITNPRFLLELPLTELERRDCHGREESPRNNPLLAAVGTVDLAVEQLNEIVDAVRERTGEARSDASTRVEQTRKRLTKRRKQLRDRLTKRREELRERGAAG